jgi:hypothetical protein
MSTFRRILARLNTPDKNAGQQVWRRVGSCLLFVNVVRSRHGNKSLARACLMSGLKIGAFIIAILSFFAFIIIGDVVALWLINKSANFPRMILMV